MAEVLNTGSNTPDNTPAPENHDAAMIAKVDQKEAELSKVGQDAPKEEKLLGKFDSAEDLAKAYQELEKKLGEKAEKKDEPTELTDDKVDELIEKAGLDVDAMAEHYEQNGGLSEEHYTALEQAGIPRAYVDQYIEGIEAQANQYRDNLMAEIGGQESFQAMSEWAVANLSQAELEAYNSAVDSGDYETVKAAVMGLAFKYQRDNGKAPTLVGGGQPTGGAGFASLAQLTEAMKDPRYEKDPAYRAEVQEKLARSNIM